MLGCGVPAFSLPWGRLQGLSASLKTKGHKAEYFKTAGTSPHRLAALPWLPRSILNAEMQRDKQLKETIKQSNYIFKLNQNTVLVTGKRKANTLCICLCNSGSTQESKNTAEKFTGMEVAETPPNTLFCKDSGPCTILHQSPINECHLLRQRGSI